MYGRESALSGQVSLKRPQADYLPQVHDPTGWASNHEDVHGRSLTNAQTGHACSEGTISAFPDPISTTLDPFANDLSIVSSQLSYGPGYIPSQDNPGNRDF